MEIAPDIHRIEAPLGDRIVCVYLLAGDERLLLVDTGLNDTPRNFIFPYLAKIGRDHIDYVLTTHGDIDHMGGNAALRARQPKACFMAHRLDRRWIEDTELIIRENYGQFHRHHGTQSNPAMDEWIHANARGTAADMELSGGEQLRLGADWWVELRHTPGHTRGHLSVLDPRSRSAIIADAALSDALYTQGGASAFPPTYRFVDEYIESAKSLLAWEPKTLLTSHYPALRDIEAKEFLERTIDYAERVERELIAELRTARQPLPALTLAQRLDRKLGAWPPTASEMLLYPLIGHLERLEKRGMIERGIIGETFTYQMT